MKINISCTYYTLHYWCTYIIEVIGSRVNDLRFSIQDSIWILHFTLEVEMFQVLEEYITVISAGCDVKPRNVLGPD